MEAQEQVRAKIRRWYVPNAIYFIVGVTQARQRLFADVANIELLRTIMRNVKELHPFKMHAYALMPDHFHLLIFVPATSTISKIMQSIQWNFTMEYKKLHRITTPTKLWQRGFWDHVIRDGRDYENHFHYIHYNPVKHGYVTRTGDYPHTSFHEYVKQGVYDPDWGQVEPDEIRKLDFE